MGLIDYVRIVRRRGWIIAFSAILGLVLAMGYNSTLVTNYTSTSRMYVSMATGTSVSDAYQGNMAAQQRVTSYVDLVTSTTVMAGVIDSLQLNMTPAQLQSQVTATFAPATVLIAVSVSNATAEGARVINDAVITQFQKLVAQIETTEIGAAPAAKVSVVDPPQTPNLPAGPSHTRNLLLGLIAGLALGCLGALVRDRLDSTLRSKDQLARVSSRPVLGAYAPKRAEVDGQLLALRMESALDGRIPAILAVESITRVADPKIVLEIAAALTRTGSAVVVVDADASAAGITGSLTLDHAVGLGDVLRRNTDLMSILVSASDGFAVLPIGNSGHDAATLFGSHRLASVLDELSNEFDYVLVASSSLASPVNALGVARRCHAVLLIAEIGHARSADVAEAIQVVEQTGTPVMGIIGAEPDSKWSDIVGRIKPAGTSAKAPLQPVSMTLVRPGSGKASSREDSDAQATPIVTEENRRAVAQSAEIAVDEPADSASALDEEPTDEPEKFAIREENIRYDYDRPEYRNPPAFDPSFDHYDPLVGYDPLGAFSSTPKEDPIPAEGSKPSPSTASDGTEPPEPDREAPESKSESSTRDEDSSTVDSDDSSDSDSDHDEHTSTDDTAGTDSTSGSVADIPRTPLSPWKRDRAVRAPDTKGIPIPFSRK